MIEKLSNNRTTIETSHRNKNRTIFSNRRSWSCFYSDEWRFIGSCTFISYYREWFRNICTFESTSTTECNIRTTCDDYSKFFINCNNISIGCSTIIERFSNGFAYFYWKTKRYRFIGFSDSCNGNNGLCRCLSVGWITFNISVEMQIHLSRTRWFESKFSRTYPRNYAIL